MSARLCRRLIALPLSVGILSYVSSYGAYPRWTRPLLALGVVLPVAGLQLRTAMDHLGLWVELASGRRCWITLGQPACPLWRQKPLFGAMA